MNDQDFKMLLESVKQMGAIMKGEDVPHRKTTLTKTSVRGLRDKTGLTQAEFSTMIGVSIRTCRIGSREEGSRRGRPRLCCGSLSVNRKPSLAHSTHK